MKIIPAFFLANLFLFCQLLSAQPIFNEAWAYPSHANYSALSLQADKLNRPYIYVASNEAGLIILNTSGENVSELTVDELGLEVMNIEQEGEVLYLALGSHFSNGPAGIGSIDISDPENPLVLDVWMYETTDETNGMGILLAENDHLYAGAMGVGFMILDKTDPENLFLKSVLTLDINYPHPMPANPNLYNARGLDIVGNLAYVTFDAGGLRVIDISNPDQPVQIGAYANPVTFEPINRPRAYNNVEVIDGVAYVTVDYCGLEALDVSDPADIQLLDHYNPVDCPDGSWYNAEVHTNEVVANADCDQLFVTGGRSELLAFDISDPENLQLNGSYGSLEDTMVTWGIDLRNDSIFLGYLIIPVYIPFLHPFDAKWSGVKMIKVNQDCLATGTFILEDKAQHLSIFPNPGSGNYTIEMKYLHAYHTLEIYDGLGRRLMNKKIDHQETVDVSLSANSGILYFRLVSKKGSQMKTVLHWE